MALLLRSAAALAALGGALARIHTLTITNDPRFVFSIESFGFLEGGKVALAVRSLAPQPAGAQHVLGFVMYPTDNQATVDANVRYLESSGICALDAAPEGALVMNVSEPALWPFFSTEGDITGGGEFDLLFTHCQPRGAAGGVGLGAADGGLGVAGASGSASAGGAPVSASFVLEATFVNPGNNYLSAGDMPLPAVFGAMAGLFALAAAAWVRWLRAHASDVHRVHHLMTLLICVKAVQLLCESLMYEYIATTGHNSFWNAMFYIFSILKTGIMCLVAVLVATGWSIMRPFLTEREKRVLGAALVLQLVANTAIIITDEWAPGSIVYLEWTDIFHIADFVAAVAVLAPLHWSLKQLQQTYASGAGADTGAKAAETLARLTALRSFYLWTIAYIYATRLLLWILAQGLSYRYTWLAPFLEEVITLAYYVFVGHRFRPSSENAYLRVSADDEDDAPGGDVARATGAAAGTIEGASGAVQTIEAARRGGAGASDSLDLELGAAAGSGGGGGGASAASLASAARAKAAGAGAGAAAGGKVAIGDEFGEDEDFGLDDIDEEKMEGGAGEPAAAAPPKATMKQVNTKR